MSNNKRTGDLLTDAAKDAQRNGMMNNRAKRARAAAANAPNRDLLFELADRIEELEAEVALLQEFAVALLQDDPNLVAAITCDHPKLKELANSAAMEDR